VPLVKEDCNVTDSPLQNVDLFGRMLVLTPGPHGESEMSSTTKSLPQPPGALLIKTTSIDV